MDETSRIKRQFAELWLKNPNNPYACAMELTDDNFQALTLSNLLVKDPEVKQFKRELIEEYGEEYFLPTKSQMVRSILDRTVEATEDGFIKLMKLAADMRGFIEKPGLTINNNTTNQNRVMLVPAIGVNNGVVDANDWQQQAITQQQGLISQ